MGSGHSIWVASRDDVFGVLSERAPDETDDSDDEDDQRSATNINGDQAVVAGTLRAPWKWESLLVESAVIGGSDRWARRLDGLAAEYELKIRELTSEEPDSPRIARLERERQNLAHLRAFALPLIEAMSAWPNEATWGDWTSASRSICAARAPAPRVRAARACRSPSHGRGWTGEPGRSARRACRSPGSAGSGAARASVRPGVRLQPRSSPRPRLPRRIRAGPGRATLSAKAARGSAPVGRSPA